MADTKTTALTAGTSLSDDDLLYFVDDPGGTPTSKKVTVANARNSGLGFPASSSFTPSWTSSGTAPSVGNGTLAGRQQQSGKLLRVEINLTFGSTTSSGTGEWSFSIPVAAASRTVQQAVGTAWAFDSGNNYYIGVVTLTTTGVLKVFPASPAGASWQSSVPFAFGNGDQVSLTALVETT